MKMTIRKIYVYQNEREEDRERERERERKKESSNECNFWSSYSNYCFRNSQGKKTNRPSTKQENNMTRKLPLYNQTFFRQNAINDHDKN